MGKGTSHRGPCALYSQRCTWHAGHCTQHVEQYTLCTRALCTDRALCAPHIGHYALRIATLCASHSVHCTAAPQRMRRTAHYAPRNLRVVRHTAPTRGHAAHPPDGTAHASCTAHRLLCAPRVVPSARRTRNRPHRAPRAPCAVRSALHTASCALSTLRTPHTAGAAHALRPLHGMPSGPCKLQTRYLAHGAWCTAHSAVQGCSRREGTSEGAPEPVRQAVGGGCQSGWGRLLSVTNAIEADTCRQGDSGWA